MPFPIIELGLILVGLGGLAARSAFLFFLASGLALAAAFLFWLATGFYSAGFENISHNSQSLSAYQDNSGSSYADYSNTAPTVGLDNPISQDGATLGQQPKDIQD